MAISFSTILITLTMSALLIIILEILLSDTRHIKTISYNVLMAVCGFIFLRLCFPLEFTFTKTVIFKFGLNSLYKTLYHSFYIYNVKLKIIYFVIFIWIIGFIYHLTKTYIILNKIKHATRYSRNLLNDYKNKFSFLNNNHLYGIYFFDNVSQPMTFFITNPVIVLPSIDYSDKELRYIFLHECQHIKNQDILIKYLVQFISSVYWWFPVIRIFQKQVSILLELRVDNQLSEKLGEIERYTYAESIVTVAQKLKLHNPTKYHAKLSNTFTTREQNLLKKRIIFYLDSKTKIKGLPAVITIFIFFISCIPTIVIEPYILDPKVESTTYTEKELVKNFYLLKKIDGSYILIDKKTNSEVATITDPHINPYKKMKTILEEEK